MPCPPRELENYCWGHDYDSNWQGRFQSSILCGKITNGVLIGSGFVLQKAYQEIE